MNLNTMTFDVVYDSSEIAGDTANPSARYAPVSFTEEYWSIKGAYEMVHKRSLETRLVEGDDPTIQLCISIPAPDTLVYEGQFADVSPSCLLPAGTLMDLVLDGQERRPYSVAAHYRVYDRKRGEFASMLLFYIRDLKDKGGLLSTYLHDRISNQEVGKDGRITISHPYRMFPLDESHSTDKVFASDTSKEPTPIHHRTFCSTGTGLAPFMLYMQHQLREIGDLIDEVNGLFATKDEPDRTRRVDSFIRAHVTIEFIHSCKSIKHQLLPDTERDYVTAEERLLWMVGLYSLLLTKVFKSFTHEELTGYYARTPLVDILSTRDTDCYDRAFYLSMLNDLTRNIPFLDDIFIRSIDVEQLAIRIRLHYQDTPDRKKYLQDVMDYYYGDLDSDGLSHWAKIYAAGYGDMLRAVGSFSQDKLGRPSHMFAYEAFTS